MISLGNGTECIVLEKGEPHCTVICCSATEGAGGEELVHLHTYTHPSTHQGTQVQIPAAWEEKYIIWLCLIQCTLHFLGRCNFWRWDWTIGKGPRDVKKPQKQTCAAMRMCWEEPAGPLLMEHFGNQKTRWSMGSTHRKYRTREI